MASEALNSNLGSAISNTAQNVLNRWSGTNMPISAAMEFMGLLATALVSTEFLALLVGVGLTGLALYSALGCM